jgi:hypothetical protein
MPQKLDELEQRFSPRQRAVVGVLAATELTLKLAAARDIGRRPADQIRGSKIFWWISLAVNTIGPVSYFLWGRRKPQP